MAIARHLSPMTAWPYEVAYILDRSRSRGVLGITTALQGPQRGGAARPARGSRSRLTLRIDERVIALVARWRCRALGTTLSIGSHHPTVTFAEWHWLGGVHTTFFATRDSAADHDLSRGRVNAGEP